MSQFIESILIKKGRVRNIGFHNERFNQTRLFHFGIHKPLDLRKLIQTKEAQGSKKVKCRILYDQEILKIEYINYQTPRIGSLKLLDSNNMDYSYKYADRKQLSKLYGQRGKADDIIICRDEEITDSYYCNLGFFDGKAWYTPKNPLLKGTQRKFLLKHSRIKERQIFKKDLFNYSKVALFNAMNPLGEIILSTESIVR